MPKFRKKPVVIEAQQFHGYGVTHMGGPVFDSKMTKFKNPDHRDICEKCKKQYNDHGWVGTLEGGHIACPGDYIIKGVAGEFYPCKPDIFDATYERVSDDDN